MAAKKKAKAAKAAPVVHQPKTAYMLDVKKIEPADVDALRRLIIGGDLKVLTEIQRDQYYVALCDAMGVDWRLRPFEYITLDGKLQLYGKSNLAEQLRNNRRINIGIIERKQVGNMYMVIARAEMGGRFDESSGIVDVQGKSGTVLANLMLKAETKAKRRVSLSICGAGMLDETEVEDSAPGAGLSDEVAAHLFGGRKPDGAPQPPAAPEPQRETLPTPAEAAKADDGERQAKEAAAAREAKIITTIEKWKKSDDGKDAMSLCLRLGYESKTAMYAKFEACNADFENFHSVVRDEWTKKMEGNK